MIKPNTNTISNVAFSLACLMFLALGAIRIEERLTGKPRSTARVPEVIENIDGKSLSIADVQIQGSPAAKVVLIEFSDFQCPYCGRHDKETHELLKKEFVDSGKVRQAFMHMPLPVHQQAKAAGEAAECAGRQGRFWEMRHELFANQAQLTSLDATRSLAATLEINQPLFSKCLKGETTAIVERHLSEAARLGIRSTPTFLIGRVGENGVVELSRKIAGAQTVDVFRTALKDVIETR